MAVLKHRINGRYRIHKSLGIANSDATQHVAFSAGALLGHKAQDVDVAGVHCQVPSRFEEITLHV